MSDAGDMTPACVGCRFFRDLPWHPRRRFFVEIANNRIVERCRVVGECRAQPPKLRTLETVSLADAEEAVWPVVLGDDWCGAFSSSEAAP